jgi:hypothetical protein
MNDISSKLEKCFSEKRQSLIDFHNGIIKALDQMIEMNELPLNTIVYQRLRDELKQEFDDPIEALGKSTDPAVNFLPMLRDLKGCYEPRIRIVDRQR